MCQKLHHIYMGWLWLVGSLKLKVSFAKETYERDYLNSVLHHIYTHLSARQRKSNAENIYIYVWTVYIIREHIYTCVKSIRHHIYTHSSAQIEYREHIYTCVWKSLHKQRTHIYMCEKCTSSCLYTLVRAFIIDSYYRLVQYLMH